MIIDSKKCTLRQHIKVPWPILNETLHAPYVLFDSCIYARFEISKDSIRYQNEMKLYQQKLMTINQDILVF